MPKYLLTLSEEMMRGLRERSEETGVPMAHHVRQGIELVLSGRSPCTLTCDGVTLSGYVAVVKVG